MESTDICDMDEFKDDPVCIKKRKQCGIMGDLFWAIVLIAVTFFTRTWYYIIDRVLTHFFGVTKSNYELAIMGITSLILILILTQFFEVNIKMDNKDV